MRIFVAVGAISSFNTFKFLELNAVYNSGFVTISTGYLLMFTGQFKFSSVVIKLCRRFKLFVVMAISTTGR